jgi:hypothetical protein
MKPALLPFADIDSQAWDACVAASGSVMPYGYATWLQAVGGPHLQGLVWQEGNSYEAVLPVSAKRKWGLVPYVAMPPLTQRLGLYAKPAAEIAQLAGQAKQILTKRYVRIHLSMEQEAAAYALTPKPQQHKNLVLDVSPSLPTLEAGLGKSIRQKRKDAQKADVQIKLSDMNIAVVFIETALQAKPGVWPSAYTQAALALAQAKSDRFMLEAEMAYVQDEAVAAMLWVVCGQRSIYLAGASSAAGLQHGAMAYMLWEKIAATAGQQGAEVDFEGGSMAGTGQFFSMFGAQPEPYWSIKMGF